LHLAQKQTFAEEQFFRRRPIHHRIKPLLEHLEQGAFPSSKASGDLLGIVRPRRQQAEGLLRTRTLQPSLLPNSTSNLARPPSHLFQHKTERFPRSAQSVSGGRLLLSQGLRCKQCRTLVRQGSRQIHILDIASEGGPHQVSADSHESIATHRASDNEQHPPELKPRRRL
jgi:hypothetical protein